MPITRVNEFQGHPGRGAELRDFLASIIGLIRGAEGCRSVQLLAQRDDDTRFAIVESWDSVEAHQAAASRISPDLMKTAMALLAAPPRGVYYNDL